MAELIARPADVEVRQIQAQDSTRAIARPNAAGAQLQRRRAPFGAPGGGKSATRAGVPVPDAPARGSPAAGEPAAERASSAAATPRHRTPSAASPGIRHIQ